MSIRYAFPFCVISNFGISKTVAGTLTVTETTAGITNDIKFVVDARNWDTQTQDLTVNLDFPNFSLYDLELSFDIECSLSEDDCVALIFEPTLIHNQTLDTYIQPVQQQIPGTDYVKENVWHNFPISTGQVGQCRLRLHAQETEHTVVKHLADKINFRKTLTYVEPTPTKDNMSLDENIEYYLGKDRLKNLYFNADIPTAWSIPARIHNPPPVVNSTTVGFFAGDTTEYHYNNLGYRSKFDYVVEDLVGKRTILCLGDSDTFGIGIDQDKIWSSLLDTDTTVLNLSVPGISIDGLTRIATQTIQALGDSIDTVLIHYPSMSLREFVSKQYKGGVHTHRNYNLPYADWWDHIDWQSNNYNFNKNRILLESICATHNVKFYDLYINRGDAKVPFDFVEFGVYSSIGPYTHQAIANYFNRKINGQPGFFESTQS